MRVSQSEEAVDAKRPKAIGWWRWLALPFVMAAAIVSVYLALYFAALASKQTGFTLIDGALPNMGALFAANAIASWAGVAAAGWVMPLHKRQARTAAAIVLISSVAALTVVALATGPGGNQPTLLAATSGWILGCLLARRNQA